MENKFAVNEDLSEYFVYFGDKIFHNSMATPDNVMKIWKEFRLLLNQRPLDVEKIKTYTKEMYNIKTTELISNISMNQLKEKSPKFREIEKIKTNFLLKNKSTIYHNENQINPFYENYELDSPCKDNVNNFPSTFAFSMHDFNSNDHKTAICMNEMGFKFTNQLSEAVNRFKKTFCDDSEILERNLDNVVKEMEKNNIEIVKSPSVSHQLVELNLKNISFYFTETYDKIRQQFQSFTN